MQSVPPYGDGVNLLSNISHSQGSPLAELDRDNQRRHDRDQVTA